MKLIYSNKICIKSATSLLYVWHPPLMWKI